MSRRRTTTSVSCLTSVSRTESRSVGHPVGVVARKKRRRQRPEILNDIGSSGQQPNAAPVPLGTHTLMGRAGESRLMEMVQARVIRLVVGLSLVTACRADSGRLTGNPLAHLPDNLELLTRFGERADISPDNRRIAFMDRTFGNAFVIDLTKRDIRCL